jgi:hypothetical protein
MSLRRFLPFLFILSLFLAAISCKDDWLKSEYDTTILWEGAFEGPVIFGNLTLEDLLEEFDSTGYVSEDSTGLLYGAYSRDTVLSAPDLLQLPDQNFLQFFFRVNNDIPGFLLGPVGDTIYYLVTPLGDTIHFDQEEGFEFERTGDGQIDSVHIKAGTMNIYVRSTLKHEGILILSSDDIRMGGQKFNEVVQISDPSGNFEETFNLDLAGGTIILDNSVPDSTSLQLSADFSLINSGADILSSEEIQVINSLRDLEFSGSYGYIGAYDSVIIPQAELEFDLLSGNFEGRIKFANPQISIRTENFMGVPFAIELGDMEAHFKDGTGTPITIDTSANPIRISAPDISQTGESVKDFTFIDTTNSDIHLAATSDLVSFQYSVRVIGNPDGPRDNFILDDSELKISIEGLIPLDLRMEDVVLGDTFDFEISSDSTSDFSSDDVKYMMMQIETDNGMPIDLGLQVYFIDSTQNWLRLDSLFGVDKNIFESGVIDADGRVIQKTNKVIEVELTRQQIDNALDANKLLFKAYIETAEGGTRDVKFYGNYSLDFKLGTRIELSYTMEPDGN